LAERREGSRKRAHEGSSAMLRLIVNNNAVLPASSLRSLFSLWFVSSLFVSSKVEDS
jgi:hypothetical protein